MREQPLARLISKDIHRPGDDYIIILYIVTVYNHDNKCSIA